MCVGSTVGLGWTSLYRSYYRTTLPLGRSVQIMVTVVEPADIRKDRTYLTVHPEREHGLLLLKMPRVTPYRYGDQLSLTTTPVAPQIINAFDYPKYLERFNIGATARQATSISLVGYSPPSRIKANLYALRTYIERQINQYVAEPEASFLSGLILGSKRAIPQSIQNDLQQTGTSHITAISGENISLMLIILLGIIPISSLRGKWWATFLIAAAISIMTGLSSSVIRGAVMACVAAYLRMYSRKVWPIPLLITSLAGMLAYNPLLLADDPGFQLSFAALTGLFLFGAGVVRFCRHWPLGLLPEAIRDPLAQTIAATVTTIPLDFKLFGQFSLLGIIVNPIILWLIFPITIIGIGLVAFSWVPFFPILAALPVWMLLHAVLSVIGWFAHFSSGVVHATISWWVVGLLYGVLTVVVLAVKNA